MTISPAQCRAARALLTWTQDDLEARSGVAKKTIADFEREVRVPRGGTVEAVQTALERAGITFIPQNGGGDGVRLASPEPRLFRRDEVGHRHWVAFAFDYKQVRRAGFVTFDVLDAMDAAGESYVEKFDAARSRLLRYAAGKVDAGQFRSMAEVEKDQILIDARDLDRLLR